LIKYRDTIENKRSAHLQVCRSFFPINVSILVFPFYEMSSGIPRKSMRRLDYIHPGIGVNTGNLGCFLPSSFFLFPSVDKKELVDSDFYCGIL